MAATYGNTGGSGTAWKKCRQIYGHDGTQWRQAKKLYAHDGTNWQLVFRGGTWTRIGSISAAWDVRMSGGTVLVADLYAGAFYLSGGSLVPLGSGIGPVSIVVNDTSTYVASAGTVFGVYVYSGSSWNKVGDIDQANAVESHNGNLYASGYRVISGTNVHGIWKWSGSSWDQVGTMRASRLRSVDGTLYACCGSYSGGKLYRFDGSSFVEIPGLTVCHDVAKLGGDLYAASGGVHKLTGSTWAEIPGISSALSLAIPSGLLVSGAYVDNDAVAVRDSAGWTTLDRISRVRVICVDSVTLYAGGDTGLYRWDGAL